MELTKTSINYNKVVDYAKNGVVISNTKNTKSETINGKNKKVDNQVSNTCFKVKNSGISGLSKLFFND